jgi:glucan phosphorylase
MPAGFYLSNQPKDFDYISFWHIRKSLVEFNIPLYYVCVIRSVQLNGVAKRHNRVVSTSFFVIASSRVQKLFQKTDIRMFCWFF